MSSVCPRPSTGACACVRHCAEVHGSGSESDFRPVLGTPAWFFASWGSCELRNTLQCIYLYFLFLFSGSRSPDRKAGLPLRPAPFCSRTGIFSPRSIVPSAAWVLCTPRRFGAWGIKRQRPRLASLVGDAVWTVS